MGKVHEILAIINRFLGKEGNKNEFVILVIRGKIAEQSQNRRLVDANTQLSSLRGKIVLVTDISVTDLQAFHGLKRLSLAQAFGNYGGGGILKPPDCKNDRLHKAVNAFRGP